MLIREYDNSTFTVAGTTKFSEPINSFLPLQKQFRNSINSVFEVNMNLSIHQLHHNLGYHNLNGFYQFNTLIIKSKMPPNPKVSRILDFWNMNAKLVLTTKYSDSCKTTSLYAFPSQSKANPHQILHKLSPVLLLLFLYSGDMVCLPKIHVLEAYSPV